MLFKNLNFDGSSCCYAKLLWIIGSQSLALQRLILSNCVVRPARGTGLKDLLPVTSTRFLLKNDLFSKSEISNNNFFCRQGRWFHGKMQISL